MRRAALRVSVFVLLAALPAVATNPYQRHVVIMALIFYFMAAGLNVVFGYAGQHAFGHPAFFGVGAYASALLAVDAGWPIAGAVAGGALMAGLIAAVLAHPCFRLRGIYFGVATFALAYVMYIVAQNWIGLTRGPMGIPSVPPLEMFPPGWILGMGREIQIHLLLLALVALSLFVLNRLISSPLGRAWIAIRENENLAASLGIFPLRYQMAAFSGGAMLAGLGGGIYAHYVGFVGTTLLGLQNIGFGFIMMIAGGTGTLAGPLIGALVFGVLPEVLRMAEEGRDLLLGVILLLSITFLPQGLVGVWSRVRHWPIFARLAGWSNGGASKPEAPPSAGSNAVRAGPPPPSLLADLPRIEPPGDRRLQVRGISRNFGGLKALDNVSFTVEPGEIVGLIGPNGAGKTTLFNIMTGFLNPSSGEMSFGGARMGGGGPAAAARLGISRTFQITSLFPELTVEENVRIATHLWARHNVLAALWRSAGFREREARIGRAVREIVNLVGLVTQREARAQALSYGDQRRLEIALALATGCRLVLLDEPAAGLNRGEMDGLRRLIVRLRERGFTFIVIEHDMQLVMGVCDRIVVLTHGQKIAEGSPEQVAGDPEVIEAYLGTGVQDA